LIPPISSRLAGHCDPLALFLADDVAQVPQRSSVQRRAARAAVIGSHTWGNAQEIFCWLKTIANFRRTRYRGRELTQLAAYLVGAAYNLMRIARLSAAAA